MDETQDAPRYQTPHAKPDVWRPVFLQELEKTGNVSKAVRKAGIVRGSAYRAREENPEFATAWDDALEVGLDSLEEEGRRRAKRQSDTLLMFFLKAHRRKTYGDTSTLNLGGTGGAIIIEHRDLPDSVKALRDLTEQLGLTMADAGSLLPPGADEPADDIPGAAPS